MGVRGAADGIYLRFQQRKMQKLVKVDFMSVIKHLLAKRRHISLY